MLDNKNQLKAGSVLPQLRGNRFDLVLLIPRSALQGRIIAKGTLFSGS